MKSLKISTLLLAVFALFACENKYPVPESNFPTHTLESLGGTRITIADIKAKHPITNPSGAPIRINEDLVVEGVIVGDDNSGNIYKALYLQDETGGINLAINQVNLYNIMPVGQKVFIKMKDLYIGDYRACHQIGFMQTSGEHKGEMGRWDWAWEIYKDPQTGEYPYRHYYPSGLPDVKQLPAVKKIRSASDITDNDICTLVELEDITFMPKGGTKITNKAGNEFILPTDIPQDSVRFSKYDEPFYYVNIDMENEDGEVTGSYLEEKFLESQLTWSLKESNVNRTLYFNDLSDSTSQTTLVVRTSGYCNFYADYIPFGKGNLVGILSKFASTYQLYIRDRNDIMFE